MKRRTKIKIISFAVFFAAAGIAWGVTETVSMKKYKRLVNTAQQEALIGFCEYLDSINTDLTKSMYAESGKMLSSLSADLSVKSAGAKESLSALYSGENQLNNIYKFLSQVGDYTSYLNSKAAAGGRITEKERETLKELLSFSQSLSRQFDYITELLYTNSLSFDELDQTLTTADKATENTVYYINAANDAEESMTDYPSLIYDGPFSDNILNKESELLKNKKKVSQTTAKKLVAQYLKCDEKYIAFENKTSGKLASYVFTKGNSRIAVTVNGGFLSYIITDFAAGEEKITHSDCVEKASAFLYDCGYTDMVSTYCSSYDGVCTVNFAFYDNGYICYPDLIKVSISLTDGTVVSLDASDYLINHTARTIEEPQIDYKTAASGLAGTLTLKRSWFAVIPTDDGREKFTYELLCEDADGRDILVYTDTQTGEQEDILILLYSDGGTLTK